MYDPLGGIPLVFGSIGIVELLPVASNPHPASPNSTLNSLSSRVLSSCEPKLPTCTPFVERAWAEVEKGRI